MRTLVAGVGNIFRTDDGFGVEVLQRLRAVPPLPAGVELLDVGIRGVHLAYQLLDGYDRLVLVDAAPHGQPPGTVSLLEVDQLAVPDAAASVAAGEAPLVDAHGLEPGAILGMLRSLGGQVDQVLLVACEPRSVEDGLDLTPVVQEAVPHAVSLVEQVVRAPSPGARTAVTPTTPTPAGEEVSR